jgi:hypothetical protein
MPETPTKPLRVLHWPTDVGGHPSGLASAERRIGLNSTVAVIRRGHFGYPVDLDLDLGSKTRVSRLAGRTRMLIDAFNCFDVIHLNFAQAFWPTIGAMGLDLPLLRQAGKRIFVTLQGCDARLPERCPVCRTGCGPCSLGESRRRQNATAYAAEHAGVVYCLNPDLLETVPNAVFMPYASIDPTEIQLPTRKPRRGRLRVVHAPSCRITKGTDSVIRACESLGDLIDLDLVEHLSRAEAMLRYAEADVVIDQLRLGWYGGLSAEAMALGKPVMCHIDHRLLQSTHPMLQKELPIIRATERTLAESLRAFANATDDERQAIGLAGRRFVERWHNPTALARWMKPHYLSGMCDGPFVPEQPTMNIELLSKAQQTPST